MTPHTNWPSAPMFQNNIRKAIPTDSPVSMSGIARRIVSLIW